VPSDSLERLLDRLEELKRPAGAPGLSRLRSLLARLSRRRFRAASALVRFHESLLFMRAYPQSAAHLRQTEKLLSSFSKRVGELREAGADLSPLTEPTVSGIAGTSFSALFGYPVVRHLARLFPARVALDWEGYEEQDRFAAVLSKFLPLIEENAYVETYFPFLEWLRAARRPGETDLDWLLKRFEQWPGSAKERADLFYSLRLWLRWDFGDTVASRTRMKRATRKIFYHTSPLIRRTDVSLGRELEGPPLPVVKLSRAAGEALLEMGRTTMAARFRELHGFNYGDGRRVVSAAAGRGVELFVWGVVPEHRLPSLAYHAALIVKNGVPHGYAEALSLFERAEVGLNLFYTFRDGESAWIYARALRLFRQLLGVKVFSVDPYQIGFHNEEGIASGAFWFYRKLGFRPVHPELLRLVVAEEGKIARRRGYRTSASALRKLASGHVIYEHETSAPGLWDRFHMRHLGLAVQRRMARRFGGDAQGLREASAREVERALGVRTAGWKEDERRAFGELALLLALIPGLSRWTEDEKEALRSIVRAKAGADEIRYVRLLGRHRRLREEIIRLGSS
jgi:hypothetical protein